MDRLDKRDKGQREWLRPVDIAPLLGVTPKRVYQMIREGELPAVTVAGAVRIPTGAWKAWLAGLNARALAGVRPVEFGTRNSGLGLGETGEDSWDAIWNGGPNGGPGEDPDAEQDQELDTFFGGEE